MFNVEKNIQNIVAVTIVCAINIYFNLFKIL